MTTLAEEALLETTEEVLKIFQNDYLLKYAYIDNPQIYERTNEFFDSWNWSEVKKTINSISMELWYNPDMIKTFNPEKFQHGSIYSNPNFVGDNLPSILEGKQSSLWLSVHRPVKFFERFLEDMIDNGQLEKIVTRRFTAKGFSKI